MERRPQRKHRLACPAPQCRPERHRQLGRSIILTTFAAGEKGFSGKITGLAVDAKTGKTLWSVTLEGVEKSPMMYAYSDSTRTVMCK
jgi:hypothetical protein